MLRWRLASAVVLIGGMVSFLWADFHYNFGRPGIWLAPVLLAVACAATAEALELLAAQRLTPRKLPVYAGVWLVVLAALLPIAVKTAPDAATTLLGPLAPLGWPLIALAIAAIGVWCGEMLRYEKPGGVIVNVALGQFLIVYLGVSLSFLALLRLFHDNAWGMTALFSLIFIVKMADAGAYFVGRSIGRNKMTPKLSPGKTVEGAFGALVFAALASYLTFAFVAPALVGEKVALPEWWRWLAYGLILAVAGMLGDLAESLLKRDMQRKDSSTWLPGLGGILDTIDALLLSAPIAYLCWACGLVGPGG